MAAVVYSGDERGSSAARAAEELGRRVLVHALVDVEDAGDRVDVPAQHYGEGGRGA